MILKIINQEVRLMRIVRCPCCKSEREVEEDIIMSVCYSCQEETVEVKIG